MILHNKKISEAGKAYEAALRSLRFKPRSSMEILKHLDKKGFSPATIEEILKRLEQEKLLDDKIFAQLYVEDRERFKPRSRFAVSFELRQKGIAQEIIAEAVASMDDENSAWAAVMKKWRQWRNLDTETLKKKVLGHLRYRGFNHGISMKTYGRCLVKQNSGEEEI